MRSTAQETKLLDTLLKVIATAIGGLLAVAGVFTQPEAWAALHSPGLFRYLVLPFLLGGLLGGVGVVALTHFNRKFEDQGLSD